MCKKFLSFVLCQRLLQLQLGTAGVGGHPHVAVVRVASAADPQFTDPLDDQRPHSHAGPMRKPTAGLSEGTASN